MSQRGIDASTFTDVRLAAFQTGQKCNRAKVLSKAKRESFYMRAENRGTNIFSFSGVPDGASGPLENNHIFTSFDKLLQWLYVFNIWIYFKGQT